MRRLAKARLQPSLPFNELWLPIFKTVRSICFPEDYFPNLQGFIPFYFVRRGPLACICQWQEKPVIYVHEILNHTETPTEVISFIFKHELLHLVIQPRLINGAIKMHPPEFFEAEFLIAPERKNAWYWIWRYLGFYLKRIPKKEGVYVKSNWRKRHLTISELELRYMKAGRIPPYRGW